MSDYLKFWHQGKALRVHRSVLEQKLGRTLKPGEVVHHRNEDKHDNRPENLEALPSQSVHMILHHLMRRRGRGVIALFPDVAFVESREAATAKPTKFVAQPGVLELPAHEDPDLVPLFPEVMM
jgi:HNH endonuclease